MSFVDYRFYFICAVALICISVLNKIIKDESRSNTWNKIILFVISCVVIYSYDYRFLLCILAVITVTYIGGILIHDSENTVRIRYTSLFVITLLAILGYFKYTNFFMETAFAMLGSQWNTLKIILPVGISFYIFSAIGYLLDVNWNTVDCERNLLDIALYLSFFPKLVCGPIVNAKDLLPQFKEKKNITKEKFLTGIQIVVFGLFKKMVIADHLGLFVDDVFYAPVAYASSTIWMAVFGNFIQLYFDFSGYSDIAIGVALVFGYKFEKNFNLPFVARNISEFWDRWHISLSTWLNEYLFNPIAMKLKRKMVDLPKDKRKKYKNIPTYFAMMITFFLSGIWHGAGITFVLWGLLHGICSVIHEIYANYMKKRHKDFVQKKNKAINVIDIAANFFVINMIQIFFRSSTVEEGLIILKRMFSQAEGIHWFSSWLVIAYMVLILATIYAYFKNGKNIKIQGCYPLMDLSTVKGLTLFLIFAGLTLIFAYFGNTYFIYGNF